MEEAIAQTIAELGGEVLRQDDPRRPKDLKLAPSDGLVLLPTSSARFPNLIVHITGTFPLATPDVYVPGNQPAGLTPHIGRLTGLICSRSYRVYANPSKPKAILERVIADAVAVLDQKYTDDQKRQHFLEEAQAYWVDDDMVRLHYLPSLFADTFVFQCIEEKRGAKKEFTILEAVRIGSNTHTVGLRIDVPEGEIITFLEGPEQWLRQNMAAQDIATRGIDAMTRLSHRPKTPDLVLVFRIHTANGDIMLSAKSVQKLKLTKFTKHNRDDWVRLFHEQIRELQRILSEDVSSRRIVRRASGSSAAQDSRFAAAAATRLAVIGCGSLGSHIIDLLLKGGMQDMYLCDKDWLLPENLARHTLSGSFLHRGKVAGLVSKAKSTYPEFKGDGSVGDIRSTEEQKKLLDWGPSLVLCAAADQSVEMLLSNLVRRGSLPGTWYCWVEPNLAAGHLVFQPAGSQSGLTDLYDEIRDDWFYRHRVIKDDSLETERETGCQTAFTPFSGADAALFSAMCARKILECIDSLPKTLTAFRWIPGSGGLQIMP